MLSAGLTLSGGAAPLQEAVERLLLLGGAWSAVNLGNVQCLLLPVQHLRTFKRRGLLISQSDSCGSLSRHRGKNDLGVAR